ncbi:MAG: peptidoglycan DD-metalloendopeptidase family protein [Melioribacteraceae bacterium]|nr:peptidoglycan DD-metalloendopeptidase family protein [Melioribacteraceae bacterium]MCF8355320.1 peptidoglycan DD-metalloendopeptidase family protein [Melioribacteraceae bacterium]MCF8395705.1 peptidoglycan DD-metalloendopeptidase family protein [Melioribacteraceae bacterium]MCF8420398.1 peptidoglycan DD-metalloendopeptidase family protein [Melioribacteraceae bacterium]
MKKKSVWLFLIVLSYLIFTGCSDNQQTIDENASVESDSLTIELNEFGLNIDSLTEHRLIVKRNQTLADLLLPFNVPYGRIVAIADSIKPVFDVRKIKVNDRYFIYTKDDSTKSIAYMIYQSDPVNYFYLNLDDTIAVSAQHKNIITRSRQLAGVINGSLWQTMSELEVSPVLALKLAELYAWQIDFYGIQAGDAFKVIFEENFIDTTFVGINKIIAAEFIHRGKNFYGFIFEQDGVYDYFDEEGNSLQKQFLKAPLKFNRISSRFSNNRFHPILKRYRAHHGIDYAAPTGTPVQAVGEGIVIEARYKGGNGNFVKIKHNSTYQSGYLHLSKYGKGVRAGSRVQQGQVIGYVGSTGLSTGPHLDFRFYKHGTAVNYLAIEFPPSHPVDEANKEEYFEIIDILKKRIDNMNLPASNNEDLVVN